MKQYLVCNLVYVEKVSTRGTKEHIIENVQASFYGTSTTKFFANYEHGLKVTGTVKVLSCYQEPYNNGELTYVEIDGTRYSILVDSKVRGPWITITLSELT